VADGRLAGLAREYFGCRIPYTQLQALAQQIQLGFLAAESRVRLRQYPEVTDGDVLVALIRDIHRDIFGATGLPFAGSFRQPGEPDVEVDSLNINHRFSGAKADRIPDLLSGLHVLFCPEDDPSDLDGVAHRGARLLESLFEIHPFHDGNGRTGRLLLLHLFFQTSDAKVGTFPKDAKSKRRYLVALRYAHRRRSLLRRDSVHGPPASGHHADPARILAKFLRPLLTESSSFTEGPPSWIPHPPSE
jgi:fido (protein-threonine AMPylation protein)